MNKFEKLARDNQPYLQLARSLIETNKCFMCNTDIGEGVITKGGMSAKYAFHMETTHGLPHEVLLDMVNESLATLHR